MKIVKIAQTLRPGDTTWIDEKFKQKSLGSLYVTYAKQPVKIQGGDKIDPQNNPNDATLTKQFPKSQYIYRAKLVGQDGQISNQEIAFGNEWIRTQQQVQPNANPVNKPQVGSPLKPGVDQTGTSGSSTEVNQGVSSSTSGPAPNPTSAPGGVPASASSKKTIKMSKHQWLLMGMRNGWLKQK